MNRFNIVLLAVSLVMSLHTMAATLKGNISDAKTNETLVGATIYAKQNNQVHDFSGLDGSYIMKNIKPGMYTIIVSYIGYEAIEQTVNIKKNDETITLNFKLNPVSISMNRVEIIGTSSKETDISARSVEKKSDNLLNIVAAKSIELSPDVTAAGILQRVSGVTMQKSANNGEAQYAIIRGMDKRYNYTLVNGIKIPSPDNANRYVPMDMFPSELLARIEVIKALTPDMEGDAIGGAMNLVFKDAPGNLLVKATYSMGYNQLLFDRPFYQFDKSVVNQKSPLEAHGSDYLATPKDFPTGNLKFQPIQPIPNISAGLSIGNRFLKNKSLGVILSASYQNIYGGANSIFFSPNSQPSEGTEPFKGNKPTFDNIQNRTYSTHQNRLGLHSKIDYVFNKKNKISFYTVYLALDKYTSRHSEGPVINGSGVGNYIVQDRSQSDLKRIYNATLQGEHQLLAPLKADWSVAFSKSWANSPDQTQLEVNSTNIDKPILQSLPRIWQHNTDQDLSGYLNLTYVLAPSESNQFEIKAGGMYRHKNRENYYNKYSLSPMLINGQPQVFTTIDEALWEFRPVEGGYGSPVNQNDYTVTENVLAYYADIKATFNEKFSVLAGVRFELTDLNYLTPMPESFVGRQGSQSYMDVLPGIHLKYSLSPKQNLRLSYFSSISRPSFFEVIPYNLPGDYFDEIGNPYLKRAKAQNVDLRYELFPKPTDQLLVGVFYKKISDPIEYAFVRAGSSALDLQPQNFGVATNYGFEMVMIKYLRNFGVSLNYTYTKSQTTTNKQYYYLDAERNIVSDYRDQTRPLQGQADHIGNLSLLYKNINRGLDMQLSAVYTGKLISQVSPYYGLDYWEYPMTTIDFSAEKTINKKKNLTLFIKAKNLLNAKAVTRINQENTYYSGTFKLPEQDDPNTILVKKEEYKPSYLLGIRFSL